MVRVPTAMAAGLGDIKTASGAAPMASLNAPIEVFGGGEGKAIAQGGAQLMEASAGLMRYAAVERAKEDERNVLEIQDKINTWEQDRILGEKGIYNVTGGNAVGLTKKTGSDYDAEKAKWLEGREMSESGRIAAERLISNYKNKIVGRVAEHEAKQEVAYRVGLVGANVEAAKNEAVFYATNEDVRAVSEATIKRNSLEISLKLGEAKQAVDESGRPVVDKRGIPVLTGDTSMYDSRVRKELGEMSVGIINRLLTAKDTEGARRVLDKAVADKVISGEMVGKVESAFQKVNDLVKSQSEEDRIMGLGLGESAALAEARSIKDPTVRDETTNRIRTRFADAERVRSKNERDMRKSAWQTLVQGGSIDDIPPAQLAVLDGTTIGAMRNFSDNRARDGIGFGKVTDPATENFLHRMYMDNKAEFASYDLEKHMPHMTERDFGVWQGYQRSIDSKNEKEAARQANYGIADGVAKKAMDASSIGYGQSASPDDAKKAQRVFSLTRSIVDDAHAQGKKASLQDIERGVAELMVAGEVENKWVNDKRRSFEVAGTEAASRFAVTDVKKQVVTISTATGVPQDDVVKIAEKLKASGKPVTLQSIKSVYGVANRGK